VALSLKPSVNWLLALIPVTVILDRVPNVAPPVVFFTAAVAIIPVASLIVRNTERVAEHTGDAIGGLLNATFGNAPEMIICIVALRAGLVDMVRASLIGAIIANLLLFLGVAFFLGGLRHHQQTYNPAATRVYSTMLLMAVISLTVPSAFNRFFGEAQAIEQQQTINLVTAGVLLAAYVLYLLFMLRTHPEVFASAKHGAEHEPGHKPTPLARGIAGLIGASVLAAWMSEILVGAAEGTGKALGMSDVFIGVVVLAAVGGAAEGGSAIATARSNKVDLSMGIALGSSIQLALFVAPLLALLSYVVAPVPLALTFSRAELGSVLFAVLIGAMVSGDGQANWYRGVQLITVYVMIALMFYFMPVPTG
jgi:Ca2+:H+ antiporter